ncbi:MAG: alpha-galactosidase [Pseudomonadota bacterium]
MKTDDALLESPHAPEFTRLSAGGTLLLLDAAKGSRPRIVYAGIDIPGVTGEELVMLATRQHAPGGTTVPIEASLLNELGTGISGPSGLIGHRGGKDWVIDLRVVNVDVIGEHQTTIRCEDTNTQIETEHWFAIDHSSGMLRCQSQIKNTATTRFCLDWCAAICLPFDQRLTRFTSFTGRWAQEFQTEEIALFNGSIVRENKAGRTSHDVFPGGILKAANTDEEAGLALGFHLAWSGNHKLRIDRHSDGQGFVQLGDMPSPGEIILSQGETYQTPEALFAWSESGTNGIAQAFHDYARRGVLNPITQAKPRPVHYNTWEAVYFDHDEATLIELARKAAEVGAERFVLDDGWFGGRRHDAAGLGDWWVSPDVYPDGLHNLARTVKELGMEFGLWFEPEMVNPDSDLYRAHPDWVLKVEGIDPPSSRNQLTLDLTKSEVFEYLLEKLSTLIGEYSIDYIKWDMNRDTHHPVSDGKGAMHRQTLRVYSLIDALRKRHPKLEIESCASGGGRADYGILRRTDRIWTSDNNDARERQAIQRGAAQFFPLGALGSHVGPRKCHITGRELPMDLRVASAVFGHMGMELDLRDESPADLGTLKAGIALYKEHRTLIHSGHYFALKSEKGTNFIGCISPDKSEALFSYAKLDSALSTHPQRIHFSGLDPSTRYQIRLVWPNQNPSISTPSIVDATGLQSAGMEVVGDALIKHGIQPPLTFPDTCLFYHLKALH